MSKDSDSSATNVLSVDFKGKKRSLEPSVPSAQTLCEQKWDLFRSWLSHGVVSVLFDARMLSVKVPNEFSSRPDLRLNFCYEFMIPDFNFNRLGVWATLLFDRGEFFCSVPWEAVYGLQSAKLNQGAVWFESFPHDQDQIKILGFSEKMCEGFSKQNDPKDTFANASNVVALDFGNNGQS